MATYTADIDTGEGGATRIEAGSLAEATRKAVEWAEAGEWREDGTVIVRVKGSDGEAREDVAVTATV